ncbi:MAG: hypothetical protein LBJ73_00560 [Rickettsiales bacterium]|jgi:hypothetical protein|nr:hypothetical protein [Rickettsiales bacterium]
MENKKTSRFSWGKFAATIFVFLALFVLGLAAGLFWNADKTNGKRLEFSQYECDSLSSQIVNVARNDGSDRGEVLKELNDIYAKNCAGRIVEKPKPASEPEKTDAEVVRNCDAVEMAIKGNRTDSDNPEYSVSDTWYYVSRAEFYATLAARGCQENSEKYRELALRDIEISRALTNDKFYDDGKTLGLIEAYKKLDMKRDAEMVIDKVKQLTDPAIDFILQVEKIINE